MDTYQNEMLSFLQNMHFSRKKYNLSFSIKEIMQENNFCLHISHFKKITFPRIQIHLSIFKVIKTKRSLVVGISIFFSFLFLYHTPAKWSSKTVNYTFLCTFLVYVFHVQVG